jgi:hypothetical protein
MTLKKIGLNLAYNAWRYQKKSNNRDCMHFPKMKILKSYGVDGLLNLERKCKENFQKKII